MTINLPRAGTISTLLNLGLLGFAVYVLLGLTGCGKGSLNPSEMTENRVQHEASKLCREEVPVHLATLCNDYYTAIEVSNDLYGGPHAEAEAQSVQNVVAHARLIMQADSAHAMSLVESVSVGQVDLLPTSN